MTPTRLDHWLDALAAQGLQLVLENDRLRAAGNRSAWTPAVRAEVSTRKPAIMQYLRLIDAGWQNAEAELITWALTTDWILEPPFTLSQGVRVVDVRTFYQAIQRDFAQGPKGPRAKAALEDLASLRRIVEGLMDEQEPSPTPHPTYELDTTPLTPTPATALKGT